MPPSVLLAAGDPAPSFTQRSAANPRYAIDTAAGRYLVLCFFPSATDPRSQQALAAALRRTDVFNDDQPVSSAFLRTLPTKRGSPIRSPVAASFGTAI